jgi:hypothetical protein
LYILKMKVGRRFSLITGLSNNITQSQLNKQFQGLSQLVSHNFCQTFWETRPFPSWICYLLLTIVSTITRLPGGTHWYPPLSEFQNYCHSRSCLQNDRTHSVTLWIGKSNILQHWIQCCCRESSALKLIMGKRGSNFFWSLSNLNGGC